MNMFSRVDVVGVCRMSAPALDFVHTELAWLER